MRNSLKTFSTPLIAAPANDNTAEKRPMNIVFTSGSIDFLKRDDNDRRFWIVDAPMKPAPAAQAKNNKALPIGFEKARAKAMRRLNKRKTQKVSANADVYLAAAIAAETSDLLKIVEKSA